MVETGGQVASAKRLISETLSADRTAADRPLPLFSSGLYAALWGGGARIS